MLNLTALNKLGVFMAVGYICAGTVVAILAGLPMFAQYLETSLYVVAAVFVATFILASAVGILLIHYLVPRYTAKAIYEQDILIYMIGMLFMTLTLNQAMFLAGIFITFEALAVFFYENFTRQVQAGRNGFPTALALAGWGVGPVLAALVFALFADYGLIAARILFAHYIVIAFWVWIQRLSMHEEYADAPTVFLQHLHDKNPEDKNASESSKEDDEPAGATPDVDAGVMIPSETTNSAGTDAKDKPDASAGTSHTSSDDERKK